MLPGTIIMLLIIVVGIFGGTGVLIAKNLKNDKKKNAASESPKEEA